MPTPTRDYARLSGLGIEFTLTVGFFGWLGYKADQGWKLTGEFPLFLLIGISAGMALGIYRMNYQLAAWQRTQKNQRAQDIDTHDQHSARSDDSGPDPS